MKNISIKILIWHMVCQMVKKIGQAFIFHVTISAHHSF